jgi:Na+/proline symporter
VRREFLLLLAGYLAVLVGVGLKSSRRMRGPRDFFLASRLGGFDCSKLRFISSQ